ncbi:MAG: oligosaccharide repeat unit polymerase [Bacteroidetes bacterium]|nr:oligosaccharide repeat unit polymerase [Bacteroidota bacterium]
MKLFSNKIPQFKFAVIFLTIYYNALIPIFNSLNKNFIDEYGLTEAAKSNKFTTGQLLVIIVAVFSLYLGSKIKSNSLYKFNYIIDITRTKGYKFLFLAYLLSFVCLIIFFAIPKDEFLDMYNLLSEGENFDYFYAQPSLSKIIFLSLIRFAGISITIYYIICILQNKKAEKYWVHLFSLFIFSLALLTGKRLEVVMTLACIYLFFIILKVSPLKRFLFSVVTILILTIIGFSRLGSTNEMTLQKFSVYPLLEGLFCNHKFVGYYEFIQTNKINYEYGQQFIAVIIAFIPRFIFINKGEILYTNASNIGIEAAPLGGGSILADVYLQGGIFIVGIFYFLLGIMFQSIQVDEKDIDTLTKGKKLNLKHILYATTFTFFLINMREGLIVSCKTQLQIFFFILLIFWVQKKIRVL